MSKYENKLVAVMNKSAEPGTIMNALAHLSLGFGAQLGPDELQLIDYETANGETYPAISRLPYIILRANSNKIRKLYEEAKARGIRFSLFTDTMTVGTWEDQIARTKVATPDTITYYGIALCGPWDEVTELTKKFSLWR